MISFDGRFLLYAYILLYTGGLLFSVSHLYHAIRFGGRDPLSVTATGIFVGGLVVITWLSFMFLINVHWSVPFDVSVPALHVGLPSAANLNF